jgi:K+-sensing histidine kinase KdpD
VPDDLKNGLFDKFCSVEERAGKARSGVGLGLYLVRLVAQGHGGSVSVTDRPGGGALVRMTLESA